MTTLKRFLAKFPDDDACLDHMMRVRYGERFNCPKCDRDARYYRVKARRSYECEFCGHQVYPTAGTPFARTRTSLRDWFHVMFMFTTTRNGVAAKEVQRQIGVTYKTAWRMCDQIRKYMGYVDGDGRLGGVGGGIVEADKHFVGGKDKQGHDDKTVVLGMLERGGEVVTRIVPDRKLLNVVPVIKDFVRHGSRMATDSANAFKDLHLEGYRHEMVNHTAKEWVRGETHTNTIEAFWSMVRRTIEGTHIWVSQKHLPKYLGEIEFRWNLRKRPDLMFDLLLQAFPRPILASSASREATD
ncbi:IS1595 family transposase [Bauldia litoralis]|uniref:Transposase zinc-ribbon domain-containing protein n=1 Tax=Bauldia litoralis TaxID=665467 RepID=A0A1G6E3U8_9HYPH|nr:IS1595 family transposase [Bauldia litoralis]SDB52000.1 Transposase zinc-ribbon domain-containing protein [Bauldia litoralis]